MKKQHIYKVAVEVKQMAAQQKGVGPLTITIDQPAAGSSQSQPFTASGTITNGPPQGMNVTLAAQNGSGMPQSVQPTFDSSSWSCSFGPGITPTGQPYVLGVTAIADGTETGVSGTFTLET
jgi:hypothetical protein